MCFQRTTQLAGKPFGVRYQEVDTELIVGQPNGVETSIGHGDALEGHLGQSVGHVQIVQDAVHVGGFHENQIAVVFGAVVGILGDDRRDE